MLERPGVYQQKHNGALLAAIMVAFTAGAADLPQVADRGVLRVLTVAGGGTHSFADNAAAPGFDREVVDGFARLHRLRVEIPTVSDWSELIPALLEGRGDLIAGPFTVTETRKQQIDFSVEVLPTRSVVVTRRPRPAVQTLDELRREKVSVLKGTSMLELLTSLNVPIAPIERRPAGGLTAAALRTGDYNCVVVDIQTAITNQRADPDLQLGMFLGPPASYGYGVRKADQKLLSELNDYLSNVRRSGTWSRLVVKYYGAAALEILQKAKGE
jgi:membrane-bound lytic murein transglycosylase F